MITQVPKFSKTSKMDEPSFGFALVMMGMVLTPGFSDAVCGLLKKKFKNKDFTYTIMRVRLLVSFSAKEKVNRLPAHQLTHLLAHTHGGVCSGISFLGLSQAPCKSFSRMFNKIKTDHADAKAPRYAQNVDVVRMGWFTCTCCSAVADSPQCLL